MQEFYGEVKEQDRINEVNRILGAFKLNPFEQLGVNFDADRDAIKRQYRKVSLLVHPDKCAHPRAADAFDILGQAQAALLEDDRFKELQYIVNMARGKRFSDSQLLHDGKMKLGVSDVSSLSGTGHLLAVGHEMPESALPVCLMSMLLICK